MAKDRPNTWSDGSRYSEDGRRPDGAKQIRGFSREQAGLGPNAGGLNAFYALQNRNLPAFYSPGGGMPTVDQVAAQAQRDGLQINRGGTLAPANSQFNPNFPSSQATPGAAPQPQAAPATPGSSYWQSVLGGGAPQPTQTQATPANNAGAGAPGSGLASFADRLMQARSAVQEMKAAQQMWQSPMQYSDAFSNPAAKQHTFNTPYGTASIGPAAKKGGSNFSSGGLNREEFFGAAKRRQGGRENKFAVAPEDGAGLYGPNPPRPS
jgi:hypothetical protein